MLQSTSQEVTVYKIYYIEIKCYSHLNTNLYIFQILSFSGMLTTANLLFYFFNLKSSINSSNLVEGEGGREGGRGRLNEMYNKNKQKTIFYKAKW